MFLRMMWCVFSQTNLKQKSRAFTLLLSGRKDQETARLGKKSLSCDADLKGKIEGNETSGIAVCMSRPSRRGTERFGFCLVLPPPRRMHTARALQWCGGLVQPLLLAKLAWAMEGLVHLEPLFIPAPRGGGSGPGWCTKAGRCAQGRVLTKRWL